MHACVYMSPRAYNICVMFCLLSWGLVRDVCVLVCFQESYPLGLEPAASSCLHTKTRATVCLLCCLLYLSFYCRQSSHCLPWRAFHSSMLLVTPRGFQSLEKMRVLSKGQLEKEENIKRDKVSGGSLLLDAFFFFFFFPKSKKLESLSDVLAPLHVFRRPLTYRLQDGFSIMSSIVCHKSHRALENNFSSLCICVGSARVRAYLLVPVSVINTRGDWQFLVFGFDSSYLLHSTGFWWMADVLRFHVCHCVMATGQCCRVDTS